MEGSLRRDGQRFPKRKSHARPDRIIEKRPNWQDYLDPDEDPGLDDPEEDLVVDVEDAEGADGEESHPGSSDRELRLRREGSRDRAMEDEEESSNA